MSEQEVYTKILKRMITKAESDLIQTSEQLIKALIIEMSTNNEVLDRLYETNHA